jgi:N-acetyl-1-D-myo-inositol-2-amino-2-deoxy-alpha-D-glucopyranoside deacetylase
MNAAGRPCAERSLLLVHAHPDDESIFTGATMARYAAEGSRVTLVTCTMGEHGANRLAGQAEAGEDRLAELRAGELEAACAALGVTDHRFLGGPGRWRDSGPPGSAAGADPRCFRRADLATAAAELAVVIREVRPQVMVTYDADGFYRHPDHIQAHRVAWQAYQEACDPRLTKFYALTMPRSVVAEAISQTPWSAGRPTPTADALRVGLPDDQVTTHIDAAVYLDAKLAALRAHASQIAVEGRYFAALGLLGMRALGTEYYTLLAGPGSPVPGMPSRSREVDLFSGV